MSRPRVLVVGDVMLDRTIWVEGSGRTDEAGSPIMRVVREATYPGGAANAAACAAALGTGVELYGVDGCDGDGVDLRTALADADVAYHNISIASRLTTVKARVRGQDSRRYDREEIGPFLGTVEVALVGAVRVQLRHADALVLSDYGKGVLTRNLTVGLIEAARDRGIPVVVDPKSTDIGRYAGCTVITPNDEEFRAVGMPLGYWFEEVRPTGVVRKLGAKGMVLNQSDGNSFVYHALCRDPVDTCGAGDCVAAAIAVGLAQGRDLREAVAFASEVAAEACRREGTGLAGQGFRLEIPPPPDPALTGGPDGLG